MPLKNLPFPAAIVLVAGLLPAVFSYANGPFVASFERFFSTTEKPEPSAGRLLLTELNCIACHTAARDFSPKKGPVIHEAGRRFQEAWLTAFLASPPTSKPGTTMPDVLHSIPESERPKTVAAIVAYLSAEEAVEPKIQASGANPVAHEFWLKGEADRGRKIYHEVGCVACHAIDDAFQPLKATQSDFERKIAALGLEPEELEEMGLAIPKEVQPVPMSNVATKYSLRSLSMFLMAPHQFRPAGRMPSLKLQPHEAADVAAYLFNSRTHSPIRGKAVEPIGEIASVSQPNAKLIAEGKAYFEKLACVNCHPTKDVTAKTFTSLLDLDVGGESKGCLTDQGLTPRFRLTMKQRLALVEAIRDFQSKGAEGRREAKTPVASSDPHPRQVSPKTGQGEKELAAKDNAFNLELTLLQLNCYACHERGGRGGVGPKQWAYFENVQQVDIGDEGRMPPPLDHVGKKLNRSWLQKVLEGKGDVRPHFRARMPIFAEHAKSLSTALVEADRHGQPVIKASVVNADKKANLDAGRELLDSGCVQCHALRGEALPGTIGIDLADLSLRIERDWFQAFLLNPASLKKNTRMPTFFPDGKSSVPHVLNGDVSLQIDSLWEYLNAKDQPLPSKLEQNRSQSFELIPTDRPILLRTFMESSSAGSHAIAVGLPEKVHFAFDARKLRPAEIWKGRFLNAQGTWFDRFAPPAAPLGDRRITLPQDGYGRIDSNQHLIALKENDRKFFGYRLDKQGVPTWLYSIANIDVEDRIEANDRQGLRRTLCFRFAAADSVERDRIGLVLADDVTGYPSASSCSTKSSLTIEVSSNVSTQRLSDDSQAYWLAELTNQATTIEVQYQW